MAKFSILNKSFTPTPVGDTASFTDNGYLAVRDPGAAIEQAYAHFGWGMSGPLRARLHEATQRQGEFKSQHEYTLEEFGLSKQWIQDELGEVLDHYKLDR